MQYERKFLYLMEQYLIANKVFLKKVITMAKIQMGLFLIGIGIGMVLSTVLPIPSDFAFIKPLLWLIFIIIGAILIINSSG